MSRTARSFAWLIFIGTLMTLFIVGNITHVPPAYPENVRLSNVAWFAGWLLVILEVISLVSLIGVEGILTNALNGKTKLELDFLPKVREAVAETKSNTVFTIIHRILDLGMTAAFAVAGWFSCAFIYVLCSQLLIPAARSNVIKRTELLCDATEAAEGDA